MHIYRDMRSCNWFWVDNNLIKQFGCRLRTAPIAVYACLCMYSKGDTCYPSLDSIATLLGVSKRTVMRAITDLESIGVIKIERSNGGKQQSHIYTLLPIAKQEGSASVSQGSASVSQGSASVSQGSASVSQVECNGVTTRVTQMHRNNTNTTILNNNSELETKKPNKVFQNKNGEAPKEPSAHQEVIAYFVGAYLAKTNNKYLFQPKDAALFSSLLKITDKVDLMKRIDTFFASHDPFYSKAGYTVGLLSSVINKLTVSKPVASGAAGRML